MLEMHLIGKKWKNNKIDGFKVLSMDLELAHWERNKGLHNYIVSIHNYGCPLVPPISLHINDFDDILEALHTRPNTVYGENYPENLIREDIDKLINAKQWLIDNFPHASIVYDVIYNDLG